MFLARTAQRVTMPAGKCFIEDGSAAVYFYNINRGSVRLFKSLPDGRRQITGFASAGDFLGLAVGGNYAFNAEAMGDVELCRFNRLALREVFGEFPALERRLLDVATHELVIAQEQMLLLGRKTALERVASFLLAWAERQQMCPAGGLPKAMQVMALPMSRMDLADYLGVTIETVSRSFSRLKRDGMIDFSNAQDVTLVLPHQLSDLAQAA